MEVFVDEVSIGTTVTNPDGTFSLVSNTPLPAGDYTATATQTTDGGTSAESNANDFTIIEPPVLEDPADGTVTNDTPPTFTGTALPGVAVEIFVEGVSIGTTTANSDGDFSFTPTTPLAAGQHDAYVIATDGTGGVSPQSNNNGFIIDVDDPAPPVFSSPADGTTTDPTVSATGTAEPGSKVIIFVDGEESGRRWPTRMVSSPSPSRTCLPGQYEITAVAVDEAGNRSAASDPVTVTVFGARPGCRRCPSQSDSDSDDDPITVARRDRRAPRLARAGRRPRCPGRCRHPHQRPRETPHPSPTLIRFSSRVGTIEA